VAGSPVSSSAPFGAGGHLDVWPFALASALFVEAATAFKTATEGFLFAQLYFLIGE